MSAAKALIYRDLTRVMRNKLRIAGTLVRPLLWLVVIGSGYSSIVPTVGKYPYQTYLMPGLIGMVLLFGSVLCSLTMAIEKESGSIRLLLVAPFSRYWIIVLRIISSAMIAVVYAFLFISIVLPFNLLPAQINYPLFCMSICMTSLLWGATGTLIAVLSRGMENFSLIINLVIFPLFFLSGALYPLNDIPTYMRLV
ncbi:MAG: ABC transporter permease, partial [Candidatus Berkiella sp.]